MSERGAERRRRRDGTAALRFRGFGWRYAGRRAWAVRGLDLLVEPGERVLLLGPSGAGKSTLLLAAAGLLTDEGGGEGEGCVEIDGVAAPAARERAGLVFQDPETQLVMNRIGDDVAFGLENVEVPEPEIWPRVDETLAAVGLGYPREHRTDQLSGGEKQRLALAGALARRPGLLLLDEPTANLDPDGAAQLRAAVGAATSDRGATMVLVEHRVEEWLPYVDRVVVVAPGGGVTADGDPRELLTTHAAALAHDGVWVPGFHPPRRAAARPPGDRVVAVSDAAFRYPGAERDALRDVSLDLRQGEAVTLVGANGSGKSTCALLLAGLLRPTRGSVRSPRAGELASLRARRLASLVGSVFQQPEHQFLTGRVRDELALGPARPGWSRADLDARATELLDRLRLSRLADANPYTLSGGEKRRLSVATALVGRPDAVVLDEPTFGQDLRTWQELVDLLAGLRDEGVALLAATHDPAFAAALADRTLAMAAGRLSSPASPAASSESSPGASPASPAASSESSPGASPASSGSSDASRVASSE